MEYILLSRYSSNVSIVKVKKHCFFHRIYAVRASLFSSEDICMNKRSQLHTSSGSFICFSGYSLSVRRDRLTSSRNTKASFFSKSLSSSLYAATRFVPTL